MKKQLVLPIIVLLLCLASVADAFVLPLRPVQSTASRVQSLLRSSVDKYISVRKDTEIVPMHFDRAMAVVYKPAGVLDAPLAPVHGHGKEISIAHHLARDLNFRRPPHAMVVQSLGRDVSGVVPFVWRYTNAAALKKQFANRSVTSIFHAIVHGRIPSTNGWVDLPIGRRNPPRSDIDVMLGKDSHTRWRVIQYAGNFTLVHLRPVTFRPHQMRVHLHHLGHPIVGDPIYASDKEPAPRMMLHQYLIRYRHPIETDRYVEHTYPTPFGLLPDAFEQPEFELDLDDSPLTPVPPLVVRHGLSQQQ